MLIRKAYKFRLKVDNSIEHKLLQYAGCCRLVWNKALSLQRELRSTGNKMLSKTDMFNLLPVWKQSAELSFLNDAPSQALQQKLIDLDRAIRDSFLKKSNPAYKRFPKFRQRNVHDSFRFPQGFKLYGNAIYLPKIGIVPFFYSRKIKGTPKQVTVTKQAGKWYIAIQTEQLVIQPAHKSNTSVGIDMGVANFATLSTGEQFKPANVLKGYADKLACEQRKLARKVKYSSNWYKQKAIISRISKKIADKRRDMIHKITTMISKSHAVVVVEDLSVRNMSASARGTADNPGKNVKAKSGLNRSILDQGWFEFKRQLEYKLRWAGGKLISVDPKHTSQTCSACGVISSDNRVSQSKFRCVNCGYENNADINAAINVLRRAGHVQIARGELGLPTR